MSLVGPTKVEDVGAAAATPGLSQDERVAVRLGVPVERHAELTDTSPRVAWWESEGEPVVSEWPCCSQVL
jgi:hypothetical protein